MMWLLAGALLVAHATASLIPVPGRTNQNIIGSALEQTKEYAVSAYEIAKDVLSSKNLPKDRSLQVAIIGSGITGASAAFTIAENARENSSFVQPPRITLFEQNDIIGGRLTTTNIFNQKELIIDTCAATVNRVLDTCVSELVADTGLTARIVTPSLRGEAVWNGNEIIGIPEDEGFRDIQRWSFAKSARWYNRYGDAVSNFSQFQTDVERNLNILGLTSFSNLAQELNRSGLLDATTKGPCYVRSDGVYAPEWCGQPKAKNWAIDVVDAALRERFFGGFENANGLSTALAFSSEQRLGSIDGGNLRLLERLIRISGAKTILNTKVDQITQITSPEGYRYNLTSTRANGTSHQQSFDIVIIASPITLANLTYQSLTSSKYTKLPVLQIPYITTTVTHFTTTSLLSAHYFNITGLSPGTLLTSNADFDSPIKPTEPPFLSIRLLDTDVRPVDTRNGSPNMSFPAQNLFKITSYQNLTDEQILAFLDDRAHGERGNPKPEISWINREYLPQSVPRPFETPSVMGLEAEDIEVAPGLFYAGGGAVAADTVEIGCRMGRNVARLIVPEKRTQRRPGNGIVFADDKTINQRWNWLQEISEHEL